jgi:hypothetical protein
MVGRVQRSEACRVCLPRRTPRRERAAGANDNRPDRVGPRAQNQLRPVSPSSSSMTVLGTFAATAASSTACRLLAGVQRMTYSACGRLARPRMAGPCDRIASISTCSSAFALHVRFEGEPVPPYNHRACRSSSTAVRTARTSSKPSSSASGVPPARDARAKTSRSDFRRSPSAPRVSAGPKARQRLAAAAGIRAARAPAR